MFGATPKPQDGGQPAQQPAPVGQTGAPPRNHR